MPPLPKRHHYVPEFLLRNFRAEDNLVRFFDKDDPASGIVFRNPSKVLVETHLYTRMHADGHRDADLETAYGRLEDASSQIIAHIVAMARASKLPNLHPIHKAIWDQFLYHQWRRVPDLHTSLFTDEYFEKLRQKAISDFEKDYRPIDHKERAWLDNKAEMDRANRNALLGSLGVESNKVLQALASRGLAVLRIKKQSKSFIIGSRPVVKLTSPGRTELTDHLVEMWLPVAPDIAIGLGRSSSEELLFDAPDHFVRGLNLASLGQSSKLVSRSETLLRSLCKL